MNDKGFYEYDPAEYFEIYIGNYESDRKAYWNDLGGWSAAEYDQAERFAQAVLKNSEQLIPAEKMDGDLSKLQQEIKKGPAVNKRFVDILNSDLPWDKKQALICDLSKDCPPDPESENSPLRLVWERFVIDMSWEAIGKIKEGASRFFQLYNLVLGSTPSKSTQQYLARLSRCFVWGFDPECIILCRAVIDTAFRDTITDKICEKHFGRPRRYYFSLSDRIQAARKEGIIDEDFAKKALMVKRRGDKAVHYQPNITKDVWETICDTVAVLEEIAQKK